MPCCYADHEKDSLPEGIEDDTSLVGRTAPTGLTYYYHDRLLNRPICTPYHNISTEEDPATMVTVSGKQNLREYICCFPKGSPELQNITFDGKRACCVCNSCFRHVDFNDVAPLYRDKWYQAQLHGLGAERTADPSLWVPEVHAIAYAYKRVVENTRELRILDIGRLIFSAKKEGEMPFGSANRNTSLSAATAFNPATRDCICELKPSDYGSEEPSTVKIVTKLSMNRIKELRRISGCTHVFSPPEMGGERELLQDIRDADSGSSDDETMAREDKSPHSLLMRIDSERDSSGKASIRDFRAERVIVSRSSHYSPALFVLRGGLQYPWSC